MSIERIEDTVIYHLWSIFVEKALDEGSDWKERTSDKDGWREGVLWDEPID